MEKIYMFTIPRYFINTPAKRVGTKTKGQSPTRARTQQDSLGFFAFRFPLRFLFGNFRRRLARLLSSKCFSHKTFLLKSDVPKLPRILKLITQSSSEYFSSKYVDIDL